MSQKKMEIFHDLVAEGRYREARGILETENLDRETVEKWSLWLDELHREERKLAGVASDKKATPQTAFNDTISLITATLFAAVAALPALWITTMVYTTPDMAITGIYMLAAVILGVMGWQRLAHLVMGDNGTVTGVFIAFGLMIYVLLSGGLYYYETIPWRYVLAAFALIYPKIAFLSWYVGKGIGLVVARSLRRMLMEPGD